MHQFLCSVGFSDMNKREQIEKLTNEIIKNPMHKVKYEREDGTVLCELSIDYGEYMGIAVRGEIGKDGKFYQEYYFPYFTGTGVTTQEKVEFEKHSDKEAYAGICEDSRLGIPIIFFVQNSLELLMETQEGKKLISTQTTLSALAEQGMVILPVYKNEEQRKARKNPNERNMLMEAAKDGNEEAIESLTIEEFDRYSMISKRIEKEDLMTIVESFIMPYSIDSDQYVILGEILDYHYTKNMMTQEEICILTVNCNNIVFDVCINSQNLTGEPKRGRRFKGIVWMQGSTFII